MTADVLSDLRRTHPLAPAHPHAGDSVGRRLRGDPGVPDLGGHPADLQHRRRHRAGLHQFRVAEDPHRQTARYLLGLAGHRRRVHRALRAQVNRTGRRETGTLIPLPVCFCTVAAVYDRRNPSRNRRPAVIDRRYSNSAAPNSKWYYRRPGIVGRRAVPVGLRIRFHSGRTRVGCGAATFFFTIVKKKVAPRWIWPNRSPLPSIGDHVRGGQKRSGGLIGWSASVCRTNTTGRDISAAWFPDFGSSLA